MNALKLLTFALFSFVVISCNDAFEKTQSMPELHPSTPITYTGDYVNVNLDVELKNDPLGIVGSKQSTKTFTLTKKDNVIQVDYEKWINQPMKVYFALRKNGMEDNKVTYFELDAKITKKPDGSYRLKSESKSIRLNVGSLSNDYYIQAMTMGFGTTMTKGADGSYYYEMKPQQCIFEADVEGKTSRALNIPLATKWTPINFMANSNGGSININNLTFTPQGVLLKFEGSNSLSKKVELRAIEMQSYGFAFLGNFKLGKSSSTIDTSASVKFEFQKSEEAYKKGGLNEWNWSEINIQLSDKNDAFKSIESGAKTNFYLYVMPNDVGDTDYRFSYRFKYKVAGSGDRDIYPSPKIWKHFDRNSIPQSNGKVITVRDAGLPESDLMITEFFHNNPGGNNYSMIEIYNPTNRNIDLRDYGLIRIRTVKDDNLAGIHPSDYYKGDGKLVLETTALVQDLWIDPSMPGYTNGDDITNEVKMMTVRQANGELPETSKKTEAIPGTGIYTIDNFSFINRYHYMSYPGTDKSTYTLRPGQTIIVGSKGFYDMVYSNPDGSGERVNDEWMPHGTSSTGMRGIKENVADGKCKYVIVVDNGVKKASGMGAGYQYSMFAGTMHHGTQHTMALVKWGKKTPSSTKYDKIVPIDESGPAFDYMIKYEEKDWDGEDSKKYLKQRYDNYIRNLNDLISSARFNGRNDDFGFIRNEYVMYPSLEFKYNLLDDNDTDNQWTKGVGDAPEIKALHSFGKRH